MKTLLTQFGRETPVWRLCLGLVFASGAFAAEPLVARSPDGTHTASVGGTGRISYCRTDSNVVVRTFYICHPKAMAFSEDGQLIVAAGGRNGISAKIKVWRIEDHQQFCEIIISGEGARALALSTDGRMVAAASLEGRVEAWSVSDEKLQWSRTLSATVKALRFSADGKKLLAQCADGTERVLAAANGRSLTQLVPAKE